MTALQPGWQTADRQPPPRAAFHVERVIDPFTRAETIGMVRHAGHAFMAESPAAAADGSEPDAGWHRLGIHYLQALASALHLVPGRPGWMPTAVWNSLVPAAGAQPDPRTALHWLPVLWGRGLRWDGAPPDTDPLGSFWVCRPGAGAAGDGSRDGTLVLMAGCAVQGVQLGSDIGLRIAVQVQGPWARVHGITLSGLGGERALRCRPAGATDTAALFGLVRALKPAIGNALGRGRKVWISGLERLRHAEAAEHRLSVRGYLLRQTTSAHTAGPPGRARVYDFCVEVDAPPGATPRVVAVQRNEFAGSAAAARSSPAHSGTARYRPARAFLADAAAQGPASRLVDRRPSRDEQRLLGVQADLLLLLPDDGALAFDGWLPGVGAGPHDQRRARLFETRGARATPDGLARGTLKVTAEAVVCVTTTTTTATDLPAGGADGPGPGWFWTDEQASIEAHVRAAELFARFSAYGIDPFAYFRFARLPLVQRARASTPSAPDGDRPHAEVRPFLGDDEVDRHVEQTATSHAARLQLLVKYGSADPSIRRLVAVASGQKRADGSPRTRAQHLGIAADPRWAWHEFGHVLNYCSTGELEFPFAHSAGDALGAIACDPLSALATADDPQAEIRFVTFPWIEVPGRSHGRAALQGYCWCGQRNVLRLDRQASPDRHHHGYYEEQILSSSLFRLYRSLGGDTRASGQKAALKAKADDDATRLEASDYCIYLIMRAISLLGADSVAPARTADQFVSALIDADLGTGAWQVTADWPFDRDPRTLQRQGGQVHKVIRWAFERQGLYATDDPGATADRHGLAPAVDVFIADRRPPTGPDAHPGGYAPVPLRAGERASGPAPWHAHADAVRQDGRQLRLQIGNRGRQTADGVALRLWWGTDAGTGALQWAAGPAHHVLAGGVPAQPDPTEVLLNELEGRGAGPGWLLISVDAPADPSNLPLGTQSPPTDRRALMTLVAHDNNLALIRLAAGG